MEPKVQPLYCFFCAKPLTTEDWIWNNLKPAFANIESVIVAMAHGDCVQKEEVEIQKAIQEGKQSKT